MNQFEIERIVRAPREVAFARYTDHAGWSEWAGVGRVSLFRPGRTERDGIGCVRSFDRLLGLREEVTEFRAPEVMSYRIVRGGFPLKRYRGHVVFEPHPDGTRVVWRTTFASRVPLIGKLAASALRVGFTRVLERFARDVESKDYGKRSA